MQYTAKRKSANRYQSRGFGKIFTCENYDLAVIVENVIGSLYTRKNTQLVNKLCSQQACNKLVNKFVAMLLFCHVVPSL